MSNTTPSPNMGLPVPVIGQETGPQWALDVNNSLNILDAHTHAPGSGVPITPIGMNISTDLSFAGNNATGLRSVNFTSQGSALSGASDLGCVYVSGADLWFNDENGNQVQITSGGTVNATSSGISSGSATASFSAGVLVVNAASNTPANIQCASILLGNNVANSKFLTLSPPSSMASNYGLTLPSLPAQTNIMSLDSAGNIAAAINVDNSTIQLASNTLSVITAGLSGITGSQIASQTITATNIANNTITRAQQASVGQQISASCGNYTHSGSSFVTITNLSITITTSGRPVVIGLMPDGTGSVSFTGYDFLLLRRNGATVALAQFLNTGGVNISMPTAQIYFDAPSAGTYTYDFQTKNASILFAIMYAYEL